MKERRFCPATSDVSNMTSPSAALRFLDLARYFLRNVHIGKALVMKVAIPAGLEPATPGLGNRCSIQLSYGTVAPRSITRRTRRSLALFRPSHLRAPARGAPIATSMAPHSGSYREPRAPVWAQREESRLTSRYYHTWHRDL